MLPAQPTVLEEPQKHRTLMALIITKSSQAQQALRIIKSITDATERLDGIEVADIDVDEVQQALKDEYILHVVEY